MLPVGLTNWQIRRHQASRGILTSNSLYKVCVQAHEGFHRQSYVDVAPHRQVCCVPTRIGTLRHCLGCETLGREPHEVGV